MDGEKRELKNIPFTEIVDKLKELNITDEEAARLDDVLAMIPGGASTPAEFMVLPPNQIMQFANQIQNLAQEQMANQPDAAIGIVVGGMGGAGLHQFDGLNYELGMNMAPAPLVVSAEEMQAKIDALKPGESTAIPYELRNSNQVRTANWHARVNGYVVNVNFDIARQLHVSERVKDADGMMIVSMDKLIIGKDKYVVSNGRSLKYYNSLKEVRRDYKSTELEILYQKEKYREYRRRTDARMVDLETKVEAIWYSPGLPGANAAHDHFASIKPSGSQ